MVNTKNLSMTPYEICESYRTAKDPNKQIKILAQLNCTNTDFIVQILKENNEPLKKRPYQKKEPTPYRPYKKEEAVNNTQEVKRAKLPEAVSDAIRRRISELDQIIEVTRKSLEKNEKTREELQEFLWIHTKKD